MKDLIVTAITLGLLGAAARMLLPLSKNFVEWLINKLVSAAENKIQGSKLGEKRKAYVIGKLKLFGIKFNDFIDDTIEIAVQNMNAKQTSAATELQSNISNEITSKVESTSEKIASKLTK